MDLLPHDSLTFWNMKTKLNQISSSYQFIATGIISDQHQAMLPLCLHHVPNTSIMRPVTAKMFCHEHEAGCNNYITIMQ